MDSIIAAALAPFAPPQSEVHKIAHPITINDDDWYIFDTITKELVDHRGPSWPESAIKEITTHEQTALKGLAIKCRGIDIWRAA